MPNFIIFCCHLIAIAIISCFILHCLILCHLVIVILTHKINCWVQTTRTKWLILIKVPIDTLIFLFALNLFFFFITGAIGITLLDLFGCPRFENDYIHHLLYLLLCRIFGSALLSFIYDLLYFVIPIFLRSHKFFKYRPPRPIIVAKSGSKKIFWLASFFGLFAYFF